MRGGDANLSRIRGWCGDSDCIHNVQESESKDCRYWNPLTRLSQVSEHWTVELNIEPGVNCIDV